jgi:hypothetical protein
MENSIFGPSQTSDFSDPDKLYGHKDLKAFASSLGMDYEEFIRINNKNAEVIMQNKLKNGNIRDRY